MGSLHYQSLPCKTLARTMDFRSTKGVLVACNARIKAVGSEVCYVVLCKENVPETTESRRMFWPAVPQPRHDFNLSCPHLDTLPKWSIK